MMDVFGIVALKGVSIVALILLACGGGLLAYRIGGPSGGSRRWAADANAAAGGFLLGAGLFHFMPESHQHFETLFPGHTFPYGFTCSAIGFAAILTLERKLFDPEKHHLEDEGHTSAALVLAIALSIHAILAGLAVGSERDALSLLAVTGALGVHKFAAAFTLGSSLMGARIAAPRFRSIILAFAVSTPVGIVLGGGIDLLLDARERQLYEGIFDGLAAGTFIYIAALDVIHEEFFHRKARWSSLGLFSLALVFMLLLSLAG